MNQIPKYVIPLTTITFGGVNAIKSIVECYEIYYKNLKNTVNEGCELTYQEYVKPIYNKNKTKTLDKQQQKIALELTEKYVNKRFNLFTPNKYYLDSIIEDRLREIKYKKK